VAGIADIVESELAVGDIIIATSKVVGNGSANVASVSWNIRGERLDPLTIGSSSVLQESAGLSGRASYNRGVHDGLNLAKQCLNSHPNSTKFRRCFGHKFTRSFEISAGAFTMEFGATSGWDPQPALIYLSFAISKSKFIQSVF